MCTDYRGGARRLGTSSTQVVEEGISLINCMLIRKNREKSKLPEENEA